MSRVLICEDEPMLAADLVLRVEGAGHQVIGICASGRDALMCLEGGAPDAAIIDLELADGRTGASIAQALMAMGTRVIIVSGHSNVGAGLGLIPHTFASKPVSQELIDELLAQPDSTPLRPVEAPRGAGESVPA